MGKPMSLIRLNQQTSYPLHSLAATRRIEHAAAAQLAPHTLMQRAGLAVAQMLADRFGCVVILTGAGSVIAAPGLTPYINANGNAKLATAGTGDVLAGMVGAHLAASQDAFQSACTATHRHGLAADTWSTANTLTASELVKLI